MQARLPIMLAGLALAMVPGTGRAQEAGATTHALRAGETLHGLAARSGSTASPMPVASRSARPSASRVAC